MSVAVCCLKHLPFKILTIFITATSEYNLDDKWKLMVFKGSSKIHCTRNSKRILTSQYSDIEHTSKISATTANIILINTAFIVKNI